MYAVKLFYCCFLLMKTCIIIVGLFGAAGCIRWSEMMSTRNCFPYVHHTPAKAAARDKKKERGEMGEIICIFKLKLLSHIAFVAGWLFRVDRCEWVKRT